ncbi:IspD/TarI family cytidylyltransferase [Paramicrobacterium fandaimingii]|uniref:IspD/TarI family cytidylyltransferase n=1 Tax=Paramicrobacterium fandaimingii TaxID=2708079 RepID=UPI00142362E0|nr:IspD/TarI family cytidylyltransferase [Microbacterium fandaimingii]
MANIAVVFAGGVGARMARSSRPKQFLEIHGRPIIVHTLDVFQQHPDIDGIAVAILPQYREHLERLVKRYELDKVQWIVDGGSTGQESRHNALKVVAKNCEPDSIVLIHDGVRPLIDADLVSRNIESAIEHGSAITCTKMTETVVVEEGTGIKDVIPREPLWTAQAPQTFRLSDVLAGYDHAVEDGEYDTIDTCTLMHGYGYDVHRVEGPRTNIKITTASDYYVCRTFLTLIEDREAFGDE